MTAIQENGRLLQYASPTLTNDKEIILAAIQQCGEAALQHVPPELQKNKDVQDALVFHCLKNDDEQVILMAIQKCGEAVLQHVSPELRNEKDIQDALVFRCLKNDDELQHDTEYFHNDKVLALEYVKSNPDNIKHIHEDLKRDPDILIAAGMVDKVEHHHQDGTIVPARTVAPPPPMDDEDCIDRTSTASITGQIQNGETNDSSATDEDESTTTDKPNDMGVRLSKSSTKNTNGSSIVGGIKTKIALSTRFSLDKSSHLSATWFTKLFKQHYYIRNRFKVFAPNAFNKKTCDPNWTDFDWKCRGTRDSCNYDNVLTDQSNRPTNDCCWRYSFRFQLEEAQSTGGFMLQLVEKGDEDYQEFGKGQKIERDMAFDIGLKIFRVYRPINGYGREYSLNDCHIEEVISAIQKWYDDGCQDNSECIVSFSTQGQPPFKTNWQDYALERQKHEWEKA